MDKNHAWSLYWQSSNQESCIATNAGEDAEVLRNIWRYFSEKLSEKSKVLDLATGNGSVPINLLSISEQLAITGVDFASISPHKFGPNESILAAVNFLPNIDIVSLPFEENSFDVVTSQFGFEYANKEQAAKEFIRVLKKSGKFLLIIHHKDSEVVKPAKTKINELTLLCEESGLFTQFECFLNNALCLFDIEQSGKHFLAQNQGKISQAITGQFFLGINQLIDFKEQLKPKSELLKLFSDMQIRMLAEKSRLEQLVSVALSLDEIVHFCDMLTLLGVTTSYQKVLLPSDSAILAWQVFGEKHGG